MLKRHEVEILLKAGHAKTEVARLSGVSLRCPAMFSQTLGNFLDCALSSWITAIWGPSIPRAAHYLRRQADVPYRHATLLPE
jgi:branched-subunit amino acid transport protein